MLHKVSLFSRKKVYFVEKIQLLSVVVAQKSRLTRMWSFLDAQTVVQWFRKWDFGRKMCYKNGKKWTNYIIYCSVSNIEHWLPYFLYLYPRVLFFFSSFHVKNIRLNSTKKCGYNSRACTIRGNTVNTFVVVILEPLLLCKEYFCQLLSCQWCS